MSVTKNRSPASQTCHHIVSPISVNKIDKASDSWQTGYKNLPKIIFRSEPIYWISYHIDHRRFFQVIPEKLIKPEFTGRQCSDIIRLGPRRKSIHFVLPFSIILNRIGNNFEKSKFSEFSVIYWISYFVKFIQKWCFIIAIGGLKFPLILLTKTMSCINILL